MKKVVFLGPTFAGQGVYTVSAVSSTKRPPVAPALDFLHPFPKPLPPSPTPEFPRFLIVSETTEVLGSTADVTRGTVEGDLANPKSGDSSAVVFGRRSRDFLRRSALLLSRNKMRKFALSLLSFLCLCLHTFCGYNLPCRRRDRKSHRRYC